MKALTVALLLLSQTAPNQQTHKQVMDERFRARMEALDQEKAARKSYVTAIARLDRLARLQRMGRYRPPVSSCHPSRFSLQETGRGTEEEIRRILSQYPE